MNGKVLDGCKGVVVQVVSEMRRCHLSVAGAIHAGAVSPRPCPCPLAGSLTNNQRRSRCPARSLRRNKSPFRGRLAHTMPAQVPGHKQARMTDAAGAGLTRGSGPAAAPSTPAASCRAPGRAAPPCPPCASRLHTQPPACRPLLRPSPGCPPSARSRPLATPGGGGMAGSGGGGEGGERSLWGAQP